MKIISNNKPINDEFLEIADNMTSFSNVNK